MRKLVCLICLISAFACSRKGSSYQQEVKAYTDTISVATKPAPFELLVKRYENPSREIWQDSEFIISQLGDISGQTIADIGVGTGYFAFQLAGTADKIIAIDVEKRFLDYIEQRKSEITNEALASKIETRLSEPDNPKLNNKEIDKALIVNTYYYLSDRETYLERLINGIAPSGQVVIVDYKSGELPVGPKETARIEWNVVKNELESVGFLIDKIDTTSLQFQYLIRATKL